MQYGLAKPRICIVNGAHSHARGLVHCWPFTEGGGTKVRDVRSKNDIVLTNFSTSAWQKQAPGTILHGTDTNSNYMRPNFTGITQLSFYSICLWFRSYTTEGANSSFWFYEDGGATALTRVYESPGTGVINFYIKDDNSSVTLISTVGNQRDGLWHHYTFVRANQAVYTYIDGQLRASNAAATIGPVTETRTTFFSNGALGVFSDDDIAEIRMYKRALTQREVQEIYTHPWDIYSNKRSTLSNIPILASIVSGNNQSALVSTALTNPLAINLSQNGLPITSDTVTWTVLSGSGTLGSATTITDINGNTSNTYTVGSAAGTNTVKATASGGASVTFTCTGTTNFRGLKAINLQLDACMSMGNLKGNLLQLTKFNEAPVGAPPRDMGIGYTISGSTVVFYTWDTVNDVWLVSGGSINTSAQLAAALSDETGTGLAVFNTSPALVTPILGTPASGVLTNCTFPTLNQDTTGNAATATALLNARTIGGTSFNGTANIKIGALNTTNVGATTSLELLGVISDETGSGSLVFGTSPTLTTPKIIGKITTVTDTYTVLTTDDTVVCNKATAFTVTLPTAVVGHKFTIDNINTGVVTVDGASTDTIDGNLTQTLNQWEIFEVQCYAANKWKVH